MNTGTLSELLDPPREFSFMPFWFWNDALDEAELLRQIDSFERNGIYGFVIHPRVGLPRDCGWMSPKLLDFMRIAIKEGARREMTVILYDEGMYPSGASAGQVVAENPAFACRGLVKVDGEVDDLPAEQQLVAVVPRADGRMVSIIDRPIGTWIRGLHYAEDDPPRSRSDWSARDTPEFRPPAADLLNPDAVACFIRLVYDRYDVCFGEHFGRTIPAIFTDEPMVLGRGNQLDARPGTTGILEHVNRFLGDDFTPHLPALWFDDEPDAAAHRQAYRRAINARLEETYYRPLHDWCAAHGIALTGHPETPHDIGHLRYFQWPGQDIVWRDVEPGEKAVSGWQSTQAKCAASAALHLGRRRNANEFMGAFGHDVPLELYEWTAKWLLIRGCNLLIPHAYFYSTRGPRVDECPPQLGPHSPWWHSEALRRFHRFCRQVCWLNTDSRHICRVALLTMHDWLPERAARVLFENQIDFNYLEARHLQSDAAIDEDGIHLAGMRYEALVVEGQDGIADEHTHRLAAFRDAGRVIRFETSNPSQLVAQLEGLIERDITVAPACAGLRYRLVEKAGRRWCMLFNEGETPIEAEVCLPGAGQAAWVDLQTGALSPATLPLALRMRPFGFGLLQMDISA